MKHIRDWAQTMIGLRVEDVPKDAVYDLHGYLNHLAAAILKDEQEGEEDTTASPDPQGEDPNAVAHAAQDPVWAVREMKRLRKAGNAALKYKNDWWELAGYLFPEEVKESGTHTIAEMQAGISAILDERAAWKESSMVNHANYLRAAEMADKRRLQIITLKAENEKLREASGK